MTTLIDDFTTGPFSVKLTDEVASRSDTQKGDMLGGSRVTSVTLDVSRNHRQPLTLDLGQAVSSDGGPDGMNLTVPVDAPASVTFVYGSNGNVRVDWSTASALVVDIAAYTSFLATTYAIVLFSDGGRRSRFNATFAAPPKEQRLTLPFKTLQPDAPGADVDLRNVTAIDFVFTFNGSARFRSFKVI